MVPRFPLYNPIPEHLKELCINQQWVKLEFRNGIKEGTGVFATGPFERNEVVCNYGGIFLNEDYVKENLFPDKEKCDYLIEIKTGYKSCFYLNHDRTTESKVYGKYLNHSAKHPNLFMRVYALNDKLEILFYAKHRIVRGTQLVWDYGKMFRGVNDCVESCAKCH